MYIRIASLFLAGLTLGCGSVPKRPTEPGSYLWVANASPIDFDGLIEVQSANPSLARPLYEGFFEAYAPLEHRCLELKWRDKRRVFTPECEWVLFFPKPEELNGDVANAAVEVRGMIEGKWLDVLLDSGAHNWVGASGGNNVVAEPLPGRQDFAKLRMSVAQLDALVGERRFNPLIEICPVGPDDKIGSPLYRASFADTYPFLDTYAGAQRPVQELVTEVLAKFNDCCSASGAVLQAINLSAHGGRAALVNDPVRRAKLYEQQLLSGGGAVLGNFGRVIFMKEFIRDAIRCGDVASGGEVRYTILVYPDASLDKGDAVARGDLRISEP